MNTFYDFLKFFHVINFVFMAFPLFNLVVVNERALLSSTFNYYADRYFENIIKHGALRCFILQISILISGILLLIFGPLGIKALFSNHIIALKTILLFTLMILLGYVHFKLQSKIEALLETVKPDSQIPENFQAQLKPYRVKRKKLATFCLFIVITVIILGLQVYHTFNPILNLILILLAALYSFKANKTIVPFGWF
ncbi:MAG: hypothetical protein HYU63_00915 [Armatimonadetes bacterium]|nr:hypothetical protein [Armatimonadota bacterium]